MPIESLGWPVSLSHVPTSDQWNDVQAMQWPFEQRLALPLTNPAEIVIPLTRYHYVWGRNPQNGIPQLFDDATITNFAVFIQHVTFDVPVRLEISVALPGEEFREVHSYEIPANTGRNLYAQGYGQSWRDPVKWLLPRSPKDLGPLIWRNDASSVYREENGALKDGLKLRLRVSCDGPSTDYYALGYATVEANFDQPPRPEDYDTFPDSNILPSDLPDGYVDMTPRYGPRYGVPSGYFGARGLKFYIQQLWNYNLQTTRFRIIAEAKHGTVITASRLEVDPGWSGTAWFPEREPIAQPGPGQSRWIFDYGEMRWVAMIGTNAYVVGHVEALIDETPTRIAFSHWGAQFRERYFIPLLHAQPGPPLSVNPVEVSVS